MPSTLVTAASGAPFPLVSGNFWSGTGGFHPVGGIQLRAGLSNSGSVYVGLSGGMTVTSGGFFLSGGGLNDGMPLAAGDSLFIPKVAFQTSGVVNVYVNCDAACSGQARIFWEAY